MIAADVYINITYTIDEEKEERERRASRVVRNKIRHRRGAQEEVYYCILL